VDLDEFGHIVKLEVYTDDHVSSFGIKPVDQKTFEKHLVSAGMAPTSAQHMQDVVGAARHEKVRSNSVLAGLPTLLSQWGSCLTTLAGMMPGARAESHVAIYGNETVEHCHSDPWRFLAVVLWLFSLVLVVLCYEKRCRSSHLRSAGTQTVDDDVTMAERTMVSLRAEARKIDLATSGTKSELIGRLIRHRHRG
jgi:hypothetical protein